mgnify:CR=1 FL=1
MWKQATNLYVLQHGDQQIGGQQHQQHGHEGSEDIAPGLSVHGYALGAQHLVLLRGLGHAGHQPAQERQKREGYRTYQGRHPELVDVQLVHDEEADGFGCART